MVSHTKIIQSLNVLIVVPIESNEQLFPGIEFYFTISEQFSHDYEQRYNNRIYERRFKSCYPPSRISMTLYHSVWKPFRAGKIAELTSKRWQRKWEPQSSNWWRRLRTWHQHRLRTRLGLNMHRQPWGQCLRSGRHFDSERGHLQDNVAFNSAWSKWLHNFNTYWLLTHF